MQKRFFFIPLTGILFLTFLFSACKKGLDTDTDTQTPVAGLMVFNLVPDKASVGVTISGDYFTNVPLQYTNYTGVYQGVFPGNRPVASFDPNSGTTLATTNQLFEDSTYYSAFILGANGKYTNLVVKDNLDSLPSSTGQAFVRYVNAIPDTVRQPQVTVTSNGTDVFNGNSPFATVSNFKGIAPGNISVSVNAESAINASRTITVENGKIYTILLVGMPEQSDSTKAVQIKFIQNGAVSTP